MNEKTLIGMCLTALALWGCETPATLANGDSVRGIIAEQIHDPGASIRNGSKAREGTDSDRALSAIAAMREGVAKPREEWTTGISTGGVISEQGK